jgi:hypothetical protein
MNHIHWYPHSKKAEFYKLLLYYDESLERDLADCRAIWYESWTHNLMVWDYWMSDRIEAVVISKKFWFIERLVKNDKIDDKVYSDFEEKVVHDTDSMPNTIYWLDWNIAVIYMLLSIQDNPLEYLCSILK